MDYPRLLSGVSIILKWVHYTPDIVATFEYSGQSDIVARKWWPKVATISEVHCSRLDTSLSFHQSLEFQRPSEVGGWGTTRVHSGREM